MILFVEMFDQNFQQKRSRPACTRNVIQRRVRSCTGTWTIASRQQLSSLVHTTSLKVDKLGLQHDSQNTRKSRWANSKFPTHFIELAEIEKSCVRVRKETRNKETRNKETRYMKPMQREWQMTLDPKTPPPRNGHTHTHSHVFQSLSCRKRSIFSNFIKGSSLTPRNTGIRGENSLRKMTPFQNTPKRCQNGRQSCFLSCQTSWELPSRVGRG